MQYNYSILKTYILTSIVTLSIFWMVSCIKKPVKTVIGYAPIYATNADWQNIKSEGPKNIINGGKIYSYNQWTFVMDAGLGIHVINTSQPENAIKTAFIRVPGCNEISIKNNILFTDNHTDLICIDISDIQHVKVTSRMEKVYQGVNQEGPPVNGVYFECPEKSKGMIIGWEEKQLNNPKCRRP